MRIFFHKDRYTKNIASATIIAIEDRTDIAITADE